MNGAVRRRVIKSSSLKDQPLLSASDDESSPRMQPSVDPKSMFEVGTQSTPANTISKEEKKREAAAWHRNLVDLVAQWAAWFGMVLKGAGSMLSQLGGTVAGLVSVRMKPQLELPPMALSPNQEANLKKLHARLAVPFDGHQVEHQDALRALWGAAYPTTKLTGLVSPQWKEMGWQGTDPSTDFRGGGFISLENLLHFAYRYPRSFRRLLNKEDGARAEWEYPFAVAGLNVTFMLIQLLDLRAPVPNSLAGRRFVGFLEGDEKAFDDLYCLAFEMMDQEWLSLKASYMEFNTVLAATRSKLEKLMANNSIKALSDLPGLSRIT